MPRLRARSRFRTLFALCLMAALLALAWQSDGWKTARYAWQLQRLPAPLRLPMPVEGVRPRDVADTWGGARSGGRRHEGTDIFASRGTPVRSSSEGVVLAVRDAGLGGRQVWVLGPGGERHYYAHLEDWAPDLRAGQRVAIGTPLGTVGDSGNAKGTPPHLHYGIYRREGAVNPWPRLQAPARADSPETLRSREMSGSSSSQRAHATDRPAANRS